MRQAFRRVGTSRCDVPAPRFRALTSGAEWSGSGRGDLREMFQSTRDGAFYALVAPHPRPGRRGAPSLPTDGDRSTPPDKIIVLNAPAFFSLPAPTRTTAS